MARISGRAGRNLRLPGWRQDMLIFLGISIGVFWRIEVAFERAGGQAGVVYKRGGEWDMALGPDDIVARIRRNMRAAGNADAALLAAVGTICRACEIPYGEVWRSYSASSVLYLKDAWHQPGHDFSAIDAESRKIALAPGVGLPGRVWQSREPMVLANLRTSMAFSRQTIALEEGFRSAVGVPVFHGDDLVAVLVFLMFDRRGHLPGLLGDLIAAVGLELSRHLAVRPDDQSGPAGTLETRAA